MRYRPSKKLRNALQVGDGWLTRRQYTLISMYASGRTRAEIILALGISTKTIDHYVREAKYRLGAQTLHHAVAIFAAATQSEDVDKRPSKQADSVGARVNGASQ